MCVCVCVCVSVQGELLTSGRSIDRETVSVYSLMVSACLTANSTAGNATGIASDESAGRCEQADWLSVAVTVLDVNDNAPQFNQSSYSLAVSTDVPLGTRLIQLTAVDQDSSPINSLVTYRIDSVTDAAGGLLDRGSGQLFAVDALSGWVSVSGGLSDTVVVDDEIVLTVVAEDHGQPVLASTTTLHINISSRRHRPPLIISPSHNATIRLTQVSVIMQSVTSVTLVQFTACRNCDTRACMCVCGLR